MTRNNLIQVQLQCKVQFYWQQGNKATGDFPVNGMNAPWLVNCQTLLYTCVYVLLFLGHEQRDRVVRVHTHTHTHKQNFIPAKSCIQFWRLLWFVSLHFTMQKVVTTLDLIVPFFFQATSPSFYLCNSKQQQHLQGTFAWCIIDGYFVTLKFKFTLILSFEVVVVFAFSSLAD